MSARTQRKITQALLALMEHNTFHEITISEICAKSSVSRGTFYNNYRTKFDVLTTESRHIIDKFVYKEINDVDNWLEEVVEEFFRVNQENNDFFTLLKQHNMCYIYGDELRKIVEDPDHFLTKKLQETVSLDKLAYLIPCATVSLIKFYEIWSSNGFKETTKELSTLFISFYKKSPKQ